MEHVIKDKDGHPVAALIAWEDYERLIAAAEDADDIAAAAAADGDETFPAHLVDRLDAGENPLRVWREYRGLTQAELAERVGVTQTNVSAIERGLTDGTVKLLVAIARVLEVDLDDLVTTPD